MKAPSALDDLGCDFAFTLRSLRRSPWVASGVIIALALGLGVNTTVLSFLDAIYLRTPAGVRAAREVRRVWMEIQFRDGSQFWSGFSYPQYAAVQGALTDQVPSAIYGYPEVASVGRTGEGVRVRVSRASASYFDVLGVRPAVGRFYDAGEDRLGAPTDVAVASCRFWQAHLGGGIRCSGADS